MSNHFHVLLRVDDGQEVSDAELMRRYKVLYPKPTKYQEASASLMLKTLQEGGEEADADGQLPKAAMLRCRVRYFTDGAILGTAEFVRGFTGAWQMERGRKHPPKPNPLRGANWGDLAVIQGLRRSVFT